MRDVEWFTYTCPFGFPVMGMFVLLSAFGNSSKQRMAKSVEFAHLYVRRVVFTGIRDSEQKNVMWIFNTW